MTANRTFTAIVAAGLAGCAVATTLAAAAASGAVRFSAAFVGAPPPGWSLQSAAASSAEGLVALGAFTEMPSGPSPAGEWGTPVRWRKEGNRMLAIPGSAGGAGQFALTAFTVQPGNAGFYALSDSSLRRGTAQPGKVELRVFLRRAGFAENRQPEPAVLTSLDAGESFDFDAFLGYLDAGDTLYVGVGPAGDPAGDETELDFSITRTPLIPVSVFPDDIRDPSALAAPGAWSLADGVFAAVPSARHHAWGRGDARSFTLKPNLIQVVPGSSERASVAAFRVPQSGYYALHDAWIASVNGKAEARILVGAEKEPRRIVATNSSARASLNTDLGYVARGEVISLAFTGAAAEFAGTIVEWAPRRPPLRVRRGADGLLDVFEPAAPRQAIDIPVARWITVPAQAGDATEAIRAAFAAAGATRSGNDYAGVRLQAGQTYLVGSQQGRGALFALRGAERIVFDGNHATLRIAAPELTRSSVSLFSVGNGHNLVFADVTVVATSIPFTTGKIIDVSPRGQTTQTVTFRVDPGALDPLKDISRNGVANAYAYAPLIPGRLALGSWTHYPGSGTPSIRATDTPGVFTHRVTRTGDSIEPGGKWLIKNKNAGLIYLDARGGAEDITLSGVDGRAAGGGHLRFSPASGINILDCRFEPDGENWISSSADSIHGRGREGVWVENTLIRGICEDVINTYGQSMVVVADDDPNDAVMSIRMFDGNVESVGPPVLRIPSPESALPGDQLVFFNPKTGRVLGYAGVKSAANGRVTLTNPVPDIDPWDPGDGRGATMVYNTRVAARFFVRDTRIMDSMRFGIYIKARGGVVFGSQFEGLSGPSVFATNEPEWPEGPPATHLWVQGCTFSQNNYGYMPRHRAFMVVDPADISIYTRRLRDPAEPEGYRAHLTRGQYANSHMKLLGNVFHDWRGLGISVRNSRNVQIRDNLFLTPAEDSVMRATLAKDPALANDGRGAFAAVFLDSVDGVRVSGNRFTGAPAGDRLVARGEDVSGVIENDNTMTTGSGANPDVSLSFSEWFGAVSEEPVGSGAIPDKVTLGGATHRAGVLGGGLHFNGTDAPALLAASVDAGNRPASQLAIALWICPESGKIGDEQVAYAQSDAQQGVVVAIARGRLVAGLWRADRGAWLDLGPAVEGMWQHVALVFDGGAATLRGFVNGTEVASAAQQVPARLEAFAGGAAFGGAAASIRLARDCVLVAGAAAFRGGIDEFRLFHRSLSPAEIAALAMRRGDDAR